MSNKKNTKQKEGSDKGLNETVVDETVNIIEDEIKPEAGTYNPLLTEPVKERPYTKPNVDMGSSMFERIPEPELKRPVISLQDEIKKDEAEPKENKPFEPINPAVTEMTDSEKQKSAETVVDMFLDVYGMINQGGAKLAQISDNNKKKIAQKVDIDYPLQLSPQHTITLNQLIDKTNADISSVCVVTDDFKAKVKPPLVRIAVKRGLGLSDEQQVAYLFIKDIGEKTAVLYSLRNTIGTLVAQIKEQNDIMKATGIPTPPPVANNTQNTQQPTENNTSVDEAQATQTGDSFYEEPVVDATIIADEPIAEPRTKKGRPSKGNKAGDKMDSLAKESGE